MAPSSEPDYLNLSEQEVDLFVAHCLLADTLESKDMSDDEKQAVSRNWFQSIRARFADVICKDKGIAAALVGPNKKDRNALFAMLMDLLVKLLPTDGIVPLGAVACKIMHYGIDKLCKDVRIEP